MKRFIFIFFVCFAYSISAFASSVMPQFDASKFPEQLFWLVTSFIILFFIMWKIAIPVVADTLVKREKKIEEDLKKAELFHEETIALKKQMQEKIAASKKIAHDMFLKVHEELSVEEARRIFLLQEKLDSRVQEMQQRISFNEELCRKKLPTVAEEVGNYMLLKLRGRSSEELASIIQKILRKG